MNEPTYQDWLRAIPEHRRNAFSVNFERGKERIERAFEDGTNIHGRGTCPCMTCAEKRRDDEARWR